MQKTLDAKLARIAADPSCQDFILADAKDADMGGGLAAPGPGADGRGYRSLEEYRQSMRDITAQGLVDVMLMSASSAEALVIDERRFEASAVTPAVRINDTTDIWMAGSAAYAQTPSLPFRSATLDHIQAGKLDPTPDERRRGADLGLYSMTLNNDAALDRASLQAYGEFRLEAERKGFRHFLEVFAPNAPVRVPADLGRFMADSIVRALAGVTRAGRPVFLKIPYLGPESMEALAAYDPTVVVGILGGPSGTTHDAFHLLAEARRHGARAAIFGRKIHHAEHSLAFVAVLRRVADGELAAEEAVRLYHAELSRLDVAPARPLADDLVLTAS